MDGVFPIILQETLIRGSFLSPGFLWILELKFLEGAEGQG